MDEHLKRVRNEFLADRYRLMAFIRSMIRDSTAAEDIFQEVWLALDEALSKGVSIESTPRWCRGAAKNLILRHWRENRRTVLTADEELLSLIETAFAEQDDNREYWRAREAAMKGCLDRLAPEEKEVLSLRYERGMLIDSIAARLGKSPNAVAKALSRLRANIRECATRTLRLQGIFS